MVIPFCLALISLLLEHYVQFGDILVQSRQKGHCPMKGHQVGQCAGPRGV